MRIAVVGDIHHLYTSEDSSYFNASAHDAVLFVGDLYNYSHQRGVRAAEPLAELRKPALFVPGNHDAVHPAQFAAELSGNRNLQRLTTFGYGRRLRDLAAALGNVTLSGYGLHTLGESLDLITGRPHSFGGPQLSFAQPLRQEYGVGSLEDSVALLCHRIDESQAEQLLFVAHNGPTGLGERRHSIWGCDFRSAEGDHGDPDLRVALDYARKQGRKVLAVVAGHMHHALRGGGQRQWVKRVDGTLYVNAARVPRIFNEGESRYHHHIDLLIENGRCEAVEVLRQTK